MSPDLRLRCGIKNSASKRGIALTDNDITEQVALEKLSGKLSGKNPVPGILRKLNKAGEILHVGV